MRLLQLLRLVVRERRDGDRVLNGLAVIVSSCLWQGAPNVRCSWLSNAVGYNVQCWRRTALACFGSAVVVSLQWGSGGGRRTEVVDKWM